MFGVGGVLLWCRGSECMLRCFDAFILEVFACDVDLS